MIKKLSVSLTAVMAFLAITVGTASAHVIVTPDQVGIGKVQTFSTGVPSEKDSPTVSVRVLIPDSLTEVSPNVKAGWQIDVKKSGTGDSAKTTEIDWTGGSIAKGFHDDFSFSARVPSSPSTLDWKAYQTYQDGSVVSWDQSPVAGKANDDSLTPYSETMVINDLTATPASSADTATMNRANIAISLSIVALGLSVFIFAASRRK